MAKLIIEPEQELGRPKPAPIEAMFNPNNYSIAKKVAWSSDASMVLDAPLLRFGGGGARELTLELFFDVTRDGGEVDVRTHTDRIVQLTRIATIRQSRRPPLCTVSWGEGQHADFPFTGVITNLTQRFTLFHANGHPLRAFLNVTFTESPGATANLFQVDGAVQATLTVRLGDTLPGIMLSLGAHPKDWRLIAEGIENPFQLRAGLTLNAKLGG